MSASSSSPLYFSISNSSNSSNILGNPVVSVVRLEVTYVATACCVFLISPYTDSGPGKIFASFFTTGNS